MEAGVALDGIGKRDVLLFYNVNLADFSCFPLATGMCKKSIVLIGQQCRYTEPHWSERKEDPLGNGKCILEIAECQHIVPPSKRGVLGSVWCALLKNFEGPLKIKERVQNFLKVQRLMSPLRPVHLYHF